MKLNRKLGTNGKPSNILKNRVFHFLIDDYPQRKKIQDIPATSGDTSDRRLLQLDWLRTIQRQKC